MNNFEHEVLDSQIPVLVDFWASWCGPCRMVSPIIAELEKEYSGKVKVGKVNVDDEKQLAMDFRILSIPTVIMFKGGKIFDKIVGLRLKEDFKDFFEKALE